MSKLNLIRERLFIEKNLTLFPGRLTWLTNFLTSKSRVSTSHRYNLGKFKLFSLYGFTHPRHSIVPSNCTLVSLTPLRHFSPRELICSFIKGRFELCNLDCRCLPYPSNSYDVVHARNMHLGVGRVPLCSLPGASSSSGFFLPHSRYTITPTSYTS